MFFFMIKIHPTKDLIMIQVDNDKIELDRKHQERVYKILKERLEGEYEKGCYCETHRMMEDRD